MVVISFEKEKLTRRYTVGAYSAFKEEFLSARDSWVCNIPGFSQQKLIVYTSAFKAKQPITTVML